MLRAEERAPALRNAEVTPKRVAIITRTLENICSGLGGEGEMVKRRVGEYFNPDI